MKPFAACVLLMVIPLFLITAAVPSAFGKVAVVIKSVNLRTDPSTTNPPIRLLLPPEPIKVMPATANNPNYLESYYRVKTENGEQGWVWGRNVSIYERTDWMPSNKWLDDDGDCQDTRHEVLVEETTIAPTFSPNGCKVTQGHWEDPYSG